MGTFKDLTGMKFHKLTVIERAGYDKHKKILWRCRCDCGNITVTHGRDLVNGHCKSCGCALNEHRREEGKYKGLSDTRPFRIWKGMIARCNNPDNNAYADYGGRGISICDEWQGTQGFFNFLSWALNNGYSDNLTIDRINNNGDYEPNNCRWATMFEQDKNRRNSVIIEWNGESHNISEWAKITGLNRSTLNNRYWRGDRGDKLFEKVRYERCHA